MPVPVMGESWDKLGSNLVSGGDLCVQTFVANETKVIAFEVIEVGSPEPVLSARLRVKGGHRNREKPLRLKVPGVRRCPAPRRR